MYHVRAFSPWPLLTPRASCSHSSTPLKVRLSVLVRSSSRIRNADAKSLWWYHITIALLAFHLKPSIHQSIHPSIQHSLKHPDSSIASHQSSSLLLTTSTFFFPTSSQFVLSAVPPLSWKDFIIARLVSSSAPAYNFLKKPSTGSPPDPSYSES